MAVTGGTDWGNLVFGGIGALSGLFSGRSASRAASDAAALSREQLEFDRAMASRATGISEEAGDALQSALEQFVSTYGSTGSFDPQMLASLGDLFAEERAGFRTGMQGAAEREGATAFARDAGMGFDTKTLARALGFTPDGSYTDYVDTSTDLTAREGVYDRLVNDLATAYLDKFQYETDRSAGEALAINDAGAIRSGMEFSTAAIEADKAAADVIARRRNQDVLSAVEAAVGQVGKLQGLDTGNLSMRMAENQGRTQRGGMLIDAARADIQDTIGGVGAAAGLLGTNSAYYWGNRSQPIREMASIIGATPNDTYETTSMAIGQQGQLQGLRGGALQEMVTMATAPYSTRLQGFTPGAQFSRNAVAGGGSLVDSTTRASAAAGSAFGTGLERLANVDWSKIRGG